MIRAVLVIAGWSSSVAAPRPVRWRSPTTRRDRASARRADDGGRGRRRRARARPRATRRAGRREPSRARGRRRPRPTGERPETDDIPRRPSPRPRPRRPPTDRASSGRPRTSQRTSAGRRRGAARPSRPAGRPDRRPARRRRAAGGRRPLRLHRARRELPRPARRAREAGHPGRRHPPRGRRRVHGRGPRPADRPAGGVLGTRAVGAANLAIGIHTARQDSTPMFALVGQVERAHRGHEAFQEIDQVATIGGLAKWAAEPGRRPTSPGSARPSARRSAGRPGPVLLSFPEDLLDEAVPATRGRAGAPPHRRGRPAGRRDPRGHRAARLRRATGHPRRRRRPAGADLDRPPALRRAAPGPDRRRVAARRRHLERPPAVPRDGRPGRRADVRERLLAADAMLVIGCRLNEPRRGMTPSRTGDAAGPTSTSTRTGRRTSPRRAHGHCRRPDVPARRRNERLVGRPCSMPRRCAPRRRNNAADRAAWEAAATVDAEADAWDGPGVHPGRVITTLRGVLPDDAILTTDAGNFAGWAGRGFRFRRPARSSARRRGRWATRCRPPSPRRSSIATGPSSRSSATAAWR